MELTDEIKQHILDNRIYHVPEQKKDQNVINTTINNYNMMNNLLANMDVIDKMNKYMGYKNLELVDIDDKIEEKYIYQVKKLETNKYKNFYMSIQNMLEVVDTVTCMCDIEKCNVLYDEKLNKLRIFSCGEWKSLLLDGGIKELIEKVQACYLDAYECYLIRKMKSSTVDHHDKMRSKEFLDEYYKFISCFDILPFVFDKSDNQVLQTNEEDTDYEEFTAQEEFYTCYKKIKENVTITECNKLRKNVKEIVKRNTKSNIIELNKKMMELFQMDESFKKDVISDITCIVAN
jgi:hypothetical protein